MARLARLTETYSLDLNKERAQTTLWFLSPTSDPLGAFAVELAPLVDTRWNAQRGLHSTKTAWIRGRLDEVNIATGHVVNGEDILTVTNAAGNGSASTLPCEVAEVLTLRTLFSSPRQRGRIYLPPFAVNAMDADGQIPIPNTVTAVDAYAGFFSSIYAGSEDWEPVVYSRTDRSVSPIVSCDMGNVFDVMRSRRRSLVEQRYSASAL